MAMPDPQRERQTEAQATALCAHCRCRAVSLSRVVVVFSAPQAVSGAAGGLRSDFRN